MPLRIFVCYFLINLAKFFCKTKGWWAMKRTLTLIILAATILTASTAAQGALDGFGSGLVGWWKFDEESGTTAADSISNNNGTLCGTTLPAWTLGKIGGGSGVQRY
jgi:hypothetical protein